MRGVEVLNQEVRVFFVVFVFFFFVVFFFKQKTAYEITV